MKTFVAGLVAMVLCCSVAVAAPAKDKAKDKKIDPAKLVGKWELVKSEDPNAPKGATVEFTKDGKLKVQLSVGGQEIEMSGSFKLDGDQLTTKLELPGGGGQVHEDTDTVKTLSNDELVLVDKDKKVTELKKKREEKK